MSIDEKAFQKAFEDTNEVYATMPPTIRRFVEAYEAAKASATEQTEAKSPRGCAKCGIWIVPQISKCPNCVEDAPIILGSRIIDQPVECWEYFCDRSYYDQWAVREKGETRWGHCFHVPSLEEAKGLTGILNACAPMRE